MPFRADDVEAFTVEQARDPLAEEDVVLGDDDPGSGHKGKPTPGGTSAGTPHAVGTFADASALHGGDDHGTHTRRCRTMSVSPDSFDKLSEKLDAARRSIRAAAGESEAELKAKVEEARKNADERAAELSARTRATSDAGEAHWQQIQNDWDAHRRNVRGRIDQLKAAQDLEDAEDRAEWAEADARDAVEFAGNAIDEAKYAMLDAILARKDASALAEAPALRPS
jgi:hypothetical protein